MKVFIVGNYGDLGNFLPNSTFVNNPEEADVLVFMGGTDVSSILYGERRGKFTQRPDIDRDLYEIGLFLQYPKKMKIGICRGSQFLTVMNGGKLIQNVNSHTQNHKVLLNDKEYVTNSTHHQMMYPYDLNDKDYNVIGYLENRSNTYTNGEGLEIETPVDVEVVLYNKTNSVAIQGHPEWMDVKDTYLQALNNLIVELYGNHTS